MQTMWWKTPKYNNKKLKGFFCFDNNIIKTTTIITTSLYKSFPLYKFSVGEQMFPPQFCGTKDTKRAPMRTR